MKTIIAAALAILLGFTSAVRLQQVAATHSLPDDSIDEIFGASHGPMDVTHKRSQIIWNPDKCCAKYSEGPKSGCRCLQFSACPKQQTDNCGKEQ